ncbi:MAG TPA: hypothetical protein VM142_14975 [Acidimicrobiales bacterium]|nr:hypothetical protein [Acidimicrobiales bacterium]
MTTPLRRRAAAAAAGTALLVLTSCSAPAAPLPPSPVVVTVTMTEYHFELPATLPRGRVVFRVVNAGHKSHKLSLAPLPKDFPPVMKQLRSSERRTLDTVAAIVPQAPGAETSFAVDLGPQRYGVFCFIIEPEGKDHARSGMAAEFRVD